MKSTYSLHAIIATLIIACAGIVLFSMPGHSFAQTGGTNTTNTAPRPEKKEMERKLMGKMASSTDGKMGDRMKHEGKEGTTTKARGADTVDVACMQTAIGTREAGLTTAWGAFNTSIGTALSARKDALTSAWGITTTSDRVKALDTAWQNWKTATKDAHKALQTARKSSWDTFKKTAHDTCKVTAPKEESHSNEEGAQVAL